MGNSVIEEREWGQSQTLMYHQETIKAAPNITDAGDCELRSRALYTRNKKGRILMRTGAFGPSCLK